MLSISDHRLDHCCAGYSRRDFLRIGALGVGGLTLADLLRARASAASPLGEAVRDKSVVFLFLHGAQLAAGYDDCEGDLTRRVREVVGPEVPIGVLLDLHCDLTDELIDAATVVASCKEYPHTDFDDRGRIYTSNSNLPLRQVEGKTARIIRLDTRE